MDRKEFRGLPGTLRAGVKRMVLAGTAVLAGVSCAWGGDKPAPAWPSGIERRWIGPEFWASPMEHWTLANGRAVCGSAGALRELIWMARELAPEDGEFTMRARLGVKGAGPAGEGLFAGFKFAITGHDPADFRAGLFKSKSLRAGLTGEGRLLLGGAKSDAAIGAGALADVVLELKAACAGNKAEVLLVAKSPGEGAELGRITATVSKTPLRGCVALAFESMEAKGSKAVGEASAWFEGWEVSGAKVEVKPGQAFGPVFWTQYTLSGRVLKLVAHLAPGAAPVAGLEFKKGGGWERAVEAKVDPLSRTAMFRVEDWDRPQPTEYRVVASYAGAGGPAQGEWVGTIRAEPSGKEDVTMAVTGCTGDGAFPNAALAQMMLQRDPDILFFYGDQVYEGNAGYAAGGGSPEEILLNYLPKIWLWGWSFRELMRDRPTLATTDDHDVYSNDLWGRGGRPALGDRAAGGYRLPPAAVNAIEDTQMGHLPDPADPAPLESGIRARFTQASYAGIGFVVIEDRKFKSAPGELGKAAIFESKDPKLDATALDKPGLTLLGDRQLAFLERWAADPFPAMKVFLSGSPLAMCSHGYGDLVVDLDSNGWPRRGRDAALRVVRKAGALMVHGDLHLASLFKHGIEAFGDGPWSYTAPAGAAQTLRVWAPREPGGNRDPGAPPWLGDFVDGFGNRLTMVAVSNKDEAFHKGFRSDNGSVLDRPKMRESGFGLLRFHKARNEVTVENWPIYDPGTPMERQAQTPGWPRTVSLKKEE